MQMSAQGVATLEHHEGVVLRAYRDVVGVWTIGAGLTAASGVVKPKAGMVISKAEATRLLQEALRRNYEPAVLSAMPGARQHEFDAGVSFHFNTGAIRKATWVQKWRAKAAATVIRARLLAWNKGGGKVLPGLVRRREDEARILLEGKYPVRLKETTASPPSASAPARWALTMSAAEKANAIAALYSLGCAYDLKLQDIPASVVRDFQRDHGLTVDGILGRATLSTLQRRLDAAAKAKPAAIAQFAATAGPATGAIDTMPLPAQADWVILAAVSAYCLWLAWRYRDAIAARVHPSLPRVAAFLRSF